MNPYNLTSSCRRGIGTRSERCSVAERPADLRVGEGAVLTNPCNLQAVSERKKRKKRGKKKRRSLTPTTIESRCPDHLSLKLKNLKLELLFTPAGALPPTTRRAKLEPARAT